MRRLRLRCKGSGPVGATTSGVMLTAATRLAPTAVLRAGVAAVAVAVALAAHVGVAGGSRSSRDSTSTYRV